MWSVEVVAREDMVDEGNGWYSFELYTTAMNDFYCRLRGTNLPPDTPNETYPLYTDALEGPGGPMLDSEAGNVECTDDACPPHINGVLDKDVEAWADLWFYSNPVFVDVKQRGHWQ
jgi:hypothetical protein